MRFAFVTVLASFATVAAACGGGGAPDGGGTPIPTVETPESTPSTTPVAPLDILRLSDEAMNELTSAKITSSYWGTVSKYVAPDAGQFSFLGEDEPSRCVFDSRVWRRSWTGEKWTAWEVEQEQTLEPLKWPAFDRASGGATSPGAIQIGATEATNVVLVEEVAYGGEPAYVLSYDFLAPSIEGPYTVWRTEWISKQTLRLLKSVTRNNDQFAGDHVPVEETYSDFNEPMEIVCRDFDSMPPSPATATPAVGGG